MQKISLNNVGKFRNKIFPCFWEIAVFVAVRFFVAPCYAADVDAADDDDGNVT